MSIVIPINKHRFPIVFIISFFLTISAGLNLIYTKTENIYLNGLFNWIINGLILAILLFYMTITLLDYIKTRFDKKAMLKITDKELFDNLSIFSCGCIARSDISDVQILKSFKVDFLVIKLVNANKYLAKQNFIKRFVLKKIYQKMGKSCCYFRKKSCLQPI